MPSGTTVTRCANLNLNQTKTKLNLIRSRRIRTSTIAPTLIIVERENCRALSVSQVSRVTFFRLERKRRHRTQSNTHSPPTHSSVWTLRKLGFNSAGASNRTATGPKAISGRGTFSASRPVVERGRACGTAAHSSQITNTRFARRRSKNFITMGRTRAFLLSTSAIRTWWRSRAMASICRCGTRRRGFALTRVSITTTFASLCLPLSRGRTMPRRNCQSYVTSSRPAVSLALKRTWKFRQYRRFGCQEELITRERS